jgi:hypothetical protein
LSHIDPDYVALSPASQQSVLAHLKTTSGQLPADVAARHARANAGKSFTLPENEQPGVLSHVLTGAENAEVEGIRGATNLVNKVLPNSAQLPVIAKDEDLSRHGAAENIGALAENAAEWIGGEEGLKALSEVAQAGKFMKNAAMWQHFVENSPNAAKVVKALGRITESAGIGGAQGGVHGAANDNAAGGAIAGAVGGAAGGAVGEAVSAVAPKVASALGVGREPVDEMMKVAKPGKWDTDFTQNFLKAAPRINEASGGKPFKSVEDVADAALQAKNDLWNGEIHDAIDRHKNEPLDVSSIAQDLRNKAANPTMMLHSPEGSAELEKEAKIFDNMAGLKVGDVEETLEHLNAKLTNEGWWKKSGAERAAAAKVGDPLAVMDEAARGIRDKLYGHLEVNGEPEIRDLKQQYGAIASIEHNLRGQVNVQGRQVPLSLKDMIALGGAAASGQGWPLAISAVDHYVNNTGRMATRAIRGAVGQEPILMKAGRAVAPAVTPATSFAGSEAAQESQKP